MLIDVWLFAVRGLGDTFRIVLDAPLALAIITPLTLVGACFHELGHATACRKGGARPGVIGVGLYLWWLVMFNDLTDTYRLDRRSRLRADLGGVYFNALFIVAIYVAYLATGFEPLLVVILVANFDIAAQFWPFVRLDGYYVISDLAGVPDLFPLIKPVLRSTLRRDRPEPAVARLRPRVRQIVTAWAITTVVALTLTFGWLITAGPGLARDALSALSGQRQVAAAALESGGTLTKITALAELALLALPVGGAVLTTGLLAVAGVGWVRRRRAATFRRQTPGRPPSLPPSASHPVRSFVPAKATFNGVSWRDWDAVVAWSARYEPKRGD